MQRCAVSRPTEGMDAKAPSMLVRLAEVARANNWTVRLREGSPEDVDSRFGMQDGWDFTAFHGDFRVYLSFARHHRNRRWCWRWGDVALRPAGIDEDVWVRYSMCLQVRLRLFG